MSYLRYFHYAIFQMGFFIHLVIFLCNFFYTHCKADFQCILLYYALYHTVLVCIIAYCFTMILFVCCFDYVQNECIVF